MHLPVPPRTVHWLAIVLFSAVVALLATPAHAQTDVPSNWPLIPSGLNAGDEFRLLLVTKRLMPATSNDISDYDAHVQSNISERGHVHIQAYAGNFKVLGSTATVNVRSHTGTTGTGGVPIYWIRGLRVADDYGDFFDGSWANKQQGRYQDSSRISGSSRNRLLCTGTADDGTTTTLPLGGADPDGDGVSECTATTINTTTATLSGRTRDTSDSPRYLALSGVFRVAAAPVVLIESVEITSDSGGDKDYEAGDEIEITVTFSEAVAVTGTPRLKIKLNGTRMAEYVGSGSTAADLVFSYTVTDRDYDLDGVSLPSNGLRLNGGTIKSQADGTDALLDLTAVPGGPAYTWFDPPAWEDISPHRVHNRPALTGVGVGPPLTGVSVASNPAVGSSYSTGETILIDVHFDKPMRVITHEGVPTYEITFDGGRRREAHYKEVVWGNTVRFAYEVQSNDYDEDGLSASERAIHWNGGLITRNGVHDDITLALRAKDDHTALSGQSAHKVNALDTTMAPVIVDAGPFTVSENQTEVATLTATDGDTASADLVWTIEGGADESALELSTAGVLTFAEAKDYEAPDDADADGAYEVDVMVSDGVYRLLANGAGALLTVRLADVDETAANTAPTGLPAISGTARVGETLTASPVGISDADGLTNATYAWQWIANDGTSDADIADATGATYTLTSAEAGRTIKVRVAYTDDGGTEETLVSTATAAVEAGLTARFDSVPTGHDGSSAFWLELSFDAAVAEGSKTHIRALLGVTGGSVTRMRRKDNRLDHWRIKIQPSSHEAVTVTLSPSPACGATGAVCTADGRALSEAISATVPGPLPTVSIAPATSPVTEGAATSFTLERTGDSTDELTVGLSVSEDGAVLGASPPTETVFAAGAATADLAVATEDDEVAEAASVVTVSFAAGTGYAIAANASQAAVTVEDDDAAPVIADTGPFTVDENGTAVVTLTATDDDTLVTNLAWSIAGGADAALFTLSADGVLAFAAAKDFEAPDDADQDGGYQITVRVTDGANPVDAALAVSVADVDEVAPVLSGASVDGDALTLTFDEGLDGNSAPAASAFSVAVGGTARGVSDVSISGSTVTLTLASAVVAGETVTVSYTVPAGANARPLRDAVENAAAGFSDRAVTNATPENNTAPTGLPTIAGTARVGDTLTASAAGIADADGLADAVFAWQWIANDGTSDADIAGATQSTYTLTSAEAGKTIKVRASFTDDGGTEETLVSNATVAVAAALPVVSIEAASSTTTEGRAAKFTLKRTGAVASALEVSVSVTQAGAVLSGTPAATVTFAAGNAEARLRLATDDDVVAEADGRVTVSVVAGSGYGVDANASAATVDVYDNDEATTAAAETLWTSTLTVESIGGALLGTVGSASALSPEDWSEDGEAFEVEQLYYFPQYSELAFTLSVAPSETGQLTLHLDDLQVQLRGSPGVRYFYWVVGHPGWQAGQTVAVKLTRTDPDAVVAAGPGVSVADAQVQEAEGAELAFQVTLATAQTSAVSVRYATSDGTATAGADYVATSGVLRFAPGETAKTVSVPVLDDAHDEGSETLTLTLSRPFGAELADGSATGTINNTGAMPEAWIARFGRTVADQVLDAVDARLRAARTAGMSLSVGGETLGGAAPQAEENSGAASDGKTASLFGAMVEEDAEETARMKALSDWLSQTAEEKDRPVGSSRTLSGRELLMGSSFSLTAETGAGGFASLWGRMAQTRFAGREDTLSLDGDVTTGLLGADYASGRWTTGLVISNSVGEGGYRGAVPTTATTGAAGAIEATVTAVTPWAGYAVTDRLLVWGAAGYGTGGLTLTPEGGAALKTDLGMMLAAAGARGALIGDDGPKLDMVGDVRWVRTTTASVSSSAASGGNLESAEADVTRLRFGLEGSWPLALDDGAAVTPRLAIGLRHDGGDAETGFGADIGGGVTFEGPAQGLTISLEGRGVLTHEASGFRDRGLAGTLAWDPQPSTGRGPKLTLTQTVGAGASGGKDALLARETLEGLAANDDGDGRQRLEARFGYGIGVSGGRFTMTPEIGLGLSDAGRDYSLGWRLTRTGSGPGSLELSLEARRRESANDNTPPGHGIGFRLTARF